MMGKATKQPFPDVSFTPVDSKLDLVSADLWGPVRVPSLGGKARYVLSIIDHATDMVWHFPLPAKRAHQSSRPWSHGAPRRSAKPTARW